MSAVAVEIVECHRDFVVAFKAAGIHSAPLRPEDGECALALVAAQFPEVRAVQGRKPVEGGLVHRIDQDTAGLLLIARNQGFYDHIMACQEAGRFQKNYHARCQYLPSCPELLGGFPPPPNLLGFHGTCSAGFTVESGFRPYGPGRKQVRPVTQDSGKFSRRKAGRGGRNPSKTGEGDLGLQSYTTSFHLIESSGTQGSFQHKPTSDASNPLGAAISELETLTVKATITKGYRHQVRCHLAWCGLPIVADPLYHPLEKTAPQMQFFATGLTFPLMEAQETDPLRTPPKASQSSKLFSMDISSRILSSL